MPPPVRMVLSSGWVETGMVPVGRENASDWKYPPAMR